MKKRILLCALPRWTKDGRTLGGGKEMFLKAVKIAPITRKNRFTILDIKGKETKNYYLMFMMKFMALDSMEYILTLVEI